MPVLVAQRYDRLGGRLSSLSFALFISRAHNLPVLMAWPYGRIHPMHIDPEDVFSPEFLEGRMIDPVRVRQIMKQQETNKGQPAEYRIIDALEVGQIPSDLDPGPIGPFADVLPTSSFSSKIQAAMETLQGQTFSGIHVRHGDLVDGQWRHFGPMERFVPYDATLEFVRARCAPGEFRVHSDEPQAARYLRDVANEAGVKDYTFTSSQAFDGIDQDVFDIFQMAFAQEIVAPQRSAYSGFAARYFGRPRHDQSPQACREWAIKNVSALKDSISVAYAAKRHLFIVHVLNKLGIAHQHMEAVLRLLDHVEATNAGNAELYLHKLRFPREADKMAVFEADLSKFIDMMEDLKQFMPARGGAMGLQELQRSLEPDDPRVPRLQEAIEVIHPL